MSLAVPKVPSPPRRIRTHRAGLLAAVALALAATRPAAGGTITVNTFADEYGTGPSCSLREAITAANSGAAFGGCPSPGSPPVVISLPAGTYTLTIPNANGANGVINANEDANATGDLDINASLTLQGAGSGSTIIQAGTTNTNGIDKVIAVNPTCASNVVVTISGVTVRFGRNTQPITASDFSFTGGGIDWCAGATGSSFTLQDAVVSDNTNVHGYGGGLNIDSLTGSSTATITNVTFQNNVTWNDSTTSQGTGAGINIFADISAVTISNCTFSGNQANRTNAGGGALAYRPTRDSSLLVTGSTFSGNSSQGIGGAIYVDGHTAGTTVTIQDSQISNNTAAASYGGGVVFGSVPLNTTPYALTNLVMTGNGAGTFGGAIYVGQANVTLSKSRIAGNSAGSGGSGIYKNVDPGTALATGNWWGCSTGPSASPCDRAASVGGVLTTSPFLRDQLGGSVGLVTNQSTALTASFLTDSSNASVPLANLGRLIGLPVTWAASAGVLSLQQTTVQSAGTATATYTAAAPGSPVVSAKVDADNTSPVSPNVLTLTVSKAGTTAAVTSHSPSPSVVGQPVSIGGSVSGLYGNAPTTPGGSIVIGDGTQSCTITLPSTSCSIPFTSVGARSVTATYAGDANFLASAASSSVSHTVGKASTTASIANAASLGTATVVGQGYPVSYSVAVDAPGAGTPTGSVSVSDGTDSCTATVAAGQCTLVSTSVGVKTITATYLGDSLFNSSPPSSGVAHTVGKATTTTGLASSVNPSPAGSSVQLTATVSPAPASGTPTGTVQFQVDGVDFGPPAALSGGSASVTTSALSVGIHTVDATYGGDGDFLSSSGSLAGGQVVQAVATAFHPVVPCRLFDTRRASGPDAGSPAFGAGEVRAFAPGTRCSLPLEARVLSLNVTAVGGTAGGELAVYRSDLAPPPTVTTLSYQAGKTRAGNGLIELSWDGSRSFSVFNGSAGTTDVVVDVNGYFQ